MAKVFQFLQVVTNLMYEIEKLPASEQQTKVILMAGDLKSVLEKYKDMYLPNIEQFTELKEQFYIFRLYQPIGVYYGMSSKDVTIVYEYKLPFIPFIGLTLHDGNVTREIERLYYDSVEGVFSEYIKRDIVIDSSSDNYFTNQAVEEYLKTGWKLVVK